MAGLGQSPAVSVSSRGQHTHRRVGRQQSQSSSSSSVGIGRRKLIKCALVATLALLLVAGLWLNLSFSFQLAAKYEQRASNSINGQGVIRASANNNIGKGGRIVGHQPDTDTATATGINNAPKVAFVISIIKCGDHQTTPEGILDAATILKHSIHQTSIRADGQRYDVANTPLSKYDYETIALVHRQAEHCTDELEDVVGYKRIIVDSPVAIDEIRGDYLRKHVHTEWCCGADEFIKLYAYNLTDYPLVVHLDIDFVMLRPMDTLYDAMLGQGQKNNNKQQWDAVELNEEEDHNKLNAYNIEAAWTRDYPDVPPGRVAAYQAGFVVLKPNPTVLEEFIEVIREGNFVEGFAFLQNGWGGKGYGGFVGAMAMQGLVAYYYDIIRPQTSVELNPCRYNHMGMEVRYLPGGKNYNERLAKRKNTHGKCRNGKDTCEDCTATPLSKVYNVHLTGCRKPWTCPSKAYNIAFAKGMGALHPDLNPQLTHVTKNIKKRADYIDLNMVRFDHCMDVHTIWTSYRKDLEDKVFALSKDPKVLDARSGSFEPQWFLGYCTDIGKYTPITIYNSESRQRMKEVWEIQRM
jgi:hypothetical protein